MATSKPKLRYHAVEIIAGSPGCPAALALKGVRLLSADAPRLPLATCDRPQDCACRYLHHDDRRAGPRRSLEKGSLPRPWAMTNRRKVRGRRETDFE
ncbi:MAG: hypothetical protein FIB04_00585 [Gammaproteobacteria bacterium]|nr:hypothetical protein [Gammaproteobacteria bacterium]